jgi:hypothetical protein
VATQTTTVEKQPKVFIGIATGPAKDYAMHYMVAALRNLDYENMEIHLAVTHFGNSESDRYLERLKYLMHSVEWKCPWTIHVTHLSITGPKDFVRLDPNPNGNGGTIVACFDIILKNLRKLRGVFLDGDYDYFLEVGGDNPPPRDTIKRLLEHKVDVAFGMCYQRPGRDEGFRQGTPLAWVYSWRMKDLDKYNLPHIMREKFKLAFANAPFVIPLFTVKNWKRLKKLRFCASGTGMVLIRRDVLKKVGWRLPWSRYASEDLGFCHQANVHGFSTLLDLKFHVPHFHEDGTVF